MATLEINERFRHSSSGDYYLKDNSSNSQKQIFFDLNFASDEEYNTSVALDFSRYFSSVISALPTNHTLTGRFIPKIDLSADISTAASLSIINTATGVVDDEEVEASSNDSATETAIRGKKVTICVVGY